MLARGHGTDGTEARASRHRVTVIDASEPPGLDLGELFHQRELLAHLVRRDVLVRYRRTVIGIAWAVARPAFVAIVFALVFGRLARVPSDGLPPIVFYSAGLVPWVYFASAVSLATGSIVENRSLVTRVYFPRLLLPLASVTSPLVDALASSLVLVVVLLANGFLPSATWLLVVPAFAFVYVAALALGILLAAANARFRDVRHAVPFAIELLMFVSPVAYPTSLVDPSYRWAMALNPMSTAIETFRFVLTGRGTFDAVAWVVSGSVVAALLVIGVPYFRTVEETFADVV